MPLPGSHSSNSAEQTTPAITLLEETFLEDSRRIFQRGSAFEISFSERMEIILEKDISEYDKKELENICNSLQEFVIRIKAYLTNGQ
jgi:hypothetical protein